ncbi:MAG: hypothetical protein ABI895_00675 [Deltaproteobacteria bacterium]
MDSIQSSDFSIVTDETAVQPLVTLTGTGDASAAQPLDDYLVRLHEQLRLRKSASVLVDVTQLEFMNSSCIKAFASWIHDVDTSDTPYSVRLRFNPGLRWQKRTLDTLTRLAPRTVQLEEAPS